MLALFGGSTADVVPGRAGPRAELQAAPSPNPIQTEYALPGTDPAAWLPPHYPPTSIHGYASETSVLPGEEVHFHIGTNEGLRYRIEVDRLGWYGSMGARLLTCLPSCGSDESGRALGGPQHDP
jgi:hypothetical protein